MLYSIYIYVCICVCEVVREQRRTKDTSRRCFVRLHLPVLCNFRRVVCARVCVYVCVYACVWVFDTSGGRAANAIYTLLFDRATITITGATLQSYRITYTPRMLTNIFCLSFQLFFFIFFFFVSFIGTRTTTRRLSQWFTNTSGSHIKFHQNTFANGRECSGIFRSADFGADEHNVSTQVGNIPPTPLLPPFTSPSSHGEQFGQLCPFLFTPLASFHTVCLPYAVVPSLSAGYFLLHGHVAKWSELLPRPSFPCPVPIPLPAPCPNNVAAM